MENFSKELKKEKVNDLKVNDLKNIKGGDGSCQKCGFSNFIRNIINMVN